MFFQIVFVSLLQLLVGLVLCFAGFRFFVVLLPLVGFFAGFLVTAQAIQQLFGGGFLSTVGSWVFGFVVGVICAIVAYLFYYGAVAILAAAVGYELAVGVLSGFGVNSGAILFLVGLVVAAALVAAVILLNLPKLFIVALTAEVGASMILGGILLAVGRISLAGLHAGVVGVLIRSSWFWFLIFVLIMIAGIVVQLFVTEEYALRSRGQAGTAGQTPIAAPRQEPGQSLSDLPPRGAEPAV